MCEVVSAAACDLAHPNHQLHVFDTWGVYPPLHLDIQGSPADFLLYFGDLYCDSSLPRKLHVDASFNS